MRLVLVTARMHGLCTHAHASWATPRSVYQMMRGAEMLFAAVFSVVFLHRKLNRLHLLGILCCVVRSQRAMPVIVLSLPSLPWLIVSSCFSPCKPAAHKQAMQVADAVANWMCVHDVKHVALVQTGITLVGVSSLLAGEGSASHQVSQWQMLAGMMLIVLSQVRLEFCVRSSHRRTPNLR